MIVSTASIASKVAAAASETLATASARGSACGQCEGTASSRTLKLLIPLPARLASLPRSSLDRALVRLLIAVFLVAMMTLDRLRRSRLFGAFGCVGEHFPSKNPRGMIRLSFSRDQMRSESVASEDDG